MGIGLRIRLRPNCAGQDHLAQKNKSSVSHSPDSWKPAHLDASGGLALLCAAVEISGGKGSPSAQTAPSSKYSFFQMGTVFFNVSISQRQASKAAARCAEATTIKTLVSPIC